MKKSVIAAGALAACVVVPANVSAQQTVSTPMDIRANVVAEACTISTPNLVDFGDVSSSSTSSAQQTFDVTVACSADFSIRIGIDAGQNFDVKQQGRRNIVDGAGSALGYLLFQPDGQTEWGDTGLLSLTATHPASVLTASVVASTPTTFVGGAALEAPAGASGLNTGEHTDTVNIIVEF